MSNRQPVVRNLTGRWELDRESSDDLLPLLRACGSSWRTRLRRNYQGSLLHITHTPLWFQLGVEGKLNEQALRLPLGGEYVEVLQHGQRAWKRASMSAQTGQVVLETSLEAGGRVVDLRDLVTRTRLRRHITFFGSGDTITLTEYYTRQETEPERLAGERAEAQARERLNAFAQGGMVQLPSRGPWAWLWGWALSWVGSAGGSVEGNGSAPGGERGSSSSSSSSGSDRPSVGAEGSGIASLPAAKGSDADLARDRLQLKQAFAASRSKGASDSWSRGDMQAFWDAFELQWETWTKLEMELVGFKLGVEAAAAAVHAAEQAAALELGGGADGVSKRVANEALRAALRDLEQFRISHPEAFVLRNKAQSEQVQVQVQVQIQVQEQAVLAPQSPASLQQRRQLGAQGRAVATRRKRGKGSSSLERDDVVDADACSDGTDVGGTSAAWEAARRALCCARMLSDDNKPTSLASRGAASHSHGGNGRTHVLGDLSGVWRRLPRRADSLEELMLAFGLPYLARLGCSAYDLVMVIAQSEHEVSLCTAQVSTADTHVFTPRVQRRQRCGPRAEGSAPVILHARNDYTVDPDGCPRVLRGAKGQRCVVRAWYNNGVDESFPDGLHALVRMGAVDECVAAAAHTLVVETRLPEGLGVLLDYFRLTSRTVLRRRTEYRRGRSNDGNLSPALSSAELDAVCLQYYSKVETHAEQQAGQAQWTRDWRQRVTRSQQASQEVQQVVQGTVGSAAAT